MDYTIEHAINAFFREHALLVDCATLLATWIVPIVFIAAIVPWLISGRGVDAGKRATTGALLSAAAALGVNQIIIRLVDRPRPFEAHSDIVPLTHASTDSSFPSDHATAAVAITVAAWIAYPRAGKVIAVIALLACISRLLIGAHYPTDVIGGALIGAIVAVIVMRVERVWLPLVVLVARLTDPLRMWVAGLPGIRAITVR